MQTARISKPARAPAYDITSRPLAAAGLTSYRCKTHFGWVMIGATNDDDAMSEAKRSSFTASRENLQVWDGFHYVPCPQH